MAKKRKSDATRLEEVDRTLYTSFCAAANALSQLYTQAMALQKVAFQAGERHALEKLYQWILPLHVEGSRVTIADIVGHIQSELEYGGEEPSMSPRLQLPFQHLQSNMHFTNSSIQTSSGLFGQAALGLASRTSQPDQAKNSVFSNALSSPVRRNLQPYQLAQGGGYYPSSALPTGSGRNHEVNSSNQNRDSHSPGSNDLSMDMHPDSPAHESY